MSKQPEYDVTSLRDGIQKSKKNIQIFEEAIEKEKATMKEYRFMIQTIERKQREKEEALKNIHIDIQKEEK